MYIRLFEDLGNLSLFREPWDFVNRLRKKRFLRDAGRLYTVDLKRFHCHLPVYIRNDE